MSEAKSRTGDCTPSRATFLSTDFLSTDFLSTDMLSTEKFQEIIDRLPSNGGEYPEYPVKEKTLKQRMRALQHDHQLKYEGIIQRFFANQSFQSGNDTNVQIKRNTQEAVGRAGN